MSLNQNRHSSSSSSVCTNQNRTTTQMKHQNSNTKRSSSKTAVKSSSSKTEFISEFFRKKGTNKTTEDESSLDSCSKTNSVSDDDFRSPVRIRKRNNLVWNLTKAQPKKTRKNGKITKNSTIKIIKDNFEGNGENPEHLQMAIALSKSSYEAEFGHTSESKAKEETPHISQILQNAKPTNLERFGFKTARPALSVEKRRLPAGISEGSKRVRNRFKYITPILKIRSTADRESLIESKISLILNQSNTTCKIKSEQLLISNELREVVCRDHQSIFQLNNIYENNRFYTDSLDMPKNYLICGHLLKDWNSIPGRNKSPGRQAKPAATGEKLLQSGSSICHETVTNKSSELSSPKGQVFSSISSLGMSPELFGSDDELWYESSHQPDDKKTPPKSSDFHSLDAKNEEASLGFSDTKRMDESNVRGHFKEFGSPANDVDKYGSKNSQDNVIEGADDDDDSNPHSEGYNASPLTRPLDYLNENPYYYSPRKLLLDKNKGNSNDTTQKGTSATKNQQSPEHTENMFEHLDICSTGISENSMKSLEEASGENTDMCASEKHKTDDLFFIKDQTIISNLKGSQHASASQNITCIELSDDSSTEDLPTNSPIFDWRENDYPNSPVGIQMNDQDNNLTPVVTNRLSSLRNSHAYNSADLNVTDYVNSLLSQENYSFDKGTASKNEEKVGSEQEVIVDEELSYSSLHATPVSTVKTPNTLDLEENSNEDIFSKAPNDATKATPVNKKYTIKTKNVTPMPDYKNMTTVLIQKELQKVGIKPLKRSRGAKLLKYIYESTHPLVDSVEVLQSSDSDDEGRIIKRRKRSCEVEQVSEPQAPLTDIIGDNILENERLEDLIFERRQSAKIPSCPVPLQVIWHNFLIYNPDIREKILLYEPLQLESIHSMLKNLGFKFNIQDLLTFLDKKCITIRTAQKQRNGYR